jgi:hypothetical protein
MYIYTKYNMFGNILKKIKLSCCCYSKCSLNEDKENNKVKIKVKKPITISSV